VGRILYGGQGIEIELDDRTMAHLQAVIASKLRRGEGFFLNWKSDVPVRGGRSAAWIAPDIPLLFQYDGGTDIELDRRWLETMTMGANSNGGLQLGDGGGDGDAG